MAARKACFDTQDKGQAAEVSSSASSSGGGAVPADPDEATEGMPLLQIPLQGPQQQCKILMRIFPPAVPRVQQLWGSFAALFRGSTGAHQ